MARQATRLSSVKNILSPEKLLQELVEQDHMPGKSKPLRLYDSGVQRWAFWMMIGCFAITVVLAATAYLTKNSYFKLSAMFVVLLTQLSTVVYQLAQLIPEMLRLPYAAKGMVRPLIETMPRELEWIERLSQLKKYELELIKDGLDLTTNQVRSRIGMLVGAVETVGVIPAIGGSILALHQFQAEQPWFSYVDWAVVLITVLYMGAVFTVSCVHKLERYALLARVALSRK